MSGHSYKMGPFDHSEPWKRELRGAYREADVRDMEAAGGTPKRYVARVVIEVDAFDDEDAKHVIEDAVDRMQEDSEEVYPAFRSVVSRIRPRHSGG